MIPYRNGRDEWKHLQHPDPYTIADLFNVPPHLIADVPRRRLWRLRRWVRRHRRDRGT